MGMKPEQVIRHHKHMQRIREAEETKPAEERRDDDQIYKLSQERVLAGQVNEYGVHVGGEK